MSLFKIKNLFLSLIVIICCLILISLINHPLNKVKAVEEFNKEDSINKFFGQFPYGLKTIEIDLFSPRRQPTKKEIYQYMIKIGAEENIPPEILYAVGYAESRLKQYKAGVPNVSFDCGIGIMQVTPSHVSYDFNIFKLKYDWKYNIRCGAKVMKNKWNYQKIGLIPSIGDGDPMILENWYFTLWAYNGWHCSNNPNELPTYVSYLGRIKKKAYQEKVIDYANYKLDRIKFKITKLPSSWLPKKGIPEKDNYPTPKPRHKSILKKTRKIDLFN